MLEQFIRNDAGKQNPTRMKSVTTMKKNSCSRKVQVIALSSMSQAQRKVAIIPMIARAASEKTPTLVIFCSVVKFLMTSYISIRLSFILQYPSERKLSRPPELLLQEWSLRYNGSSRQTPTDALPERPHSKNSASPLRLYLDRPRPPSLAPHMASC